MPKKLNSQCQNKENNSIASQNTRKCRKGSSQMVSKTKSSNQINKVILKINVISNVNPFNFFAKIGNKKNILPEIPFANKMRNISNFTCESSKILTNLECFQNKAQINQRNEKSDTFYKRKATNLMKLSKLNELLFH